MSGRRTLWLSLALLALLSPVGLEAPRLLNSGGAWGEWTPLEVSQRLGYLPAGVEAGARFWHAPLANYAFLGRPNTGFAYIVSACVGLAACAGATYMLSRWLRHRRP